ncbi:MAG TPA: MBL fold metallo-hydrolase [Candidatus Acidoferrales bacterium]|nr:MBL fold metallo-hydrolase [Candidatus Acidoferrales bacterium]
MKIRSSIAIAFATVALCFVSAVQAQELGPHFTKIKDGIYVETAKSTPQANSNGSIVFTSEGIVLVDTGQTAIDSREILEATKKLSPLPVKFIIDTETHPDHTYGHFLFPNAVIINAQGAGDEMRQSFDAKRMADQAKSSPQMAAALEGFKLIPPQIEYGDKMVLHVGERTFILYNLGTTHSLANTAVWLPNEKVLFAASVAVEKQINTIRPHTNIPDMIAMLKMMQGLNPEVVIPGHGVPTTTKMLADYQKYLETLLARVNDLMKQGKSLDEIKAEIKMPEYENLEGAKERLSNNVEAAYRTLKSGYVPSGQ